MRFLKTKKLILTIYYGFFLCLIINANVLKLMETQYITKSVATDVSTYFKEEFVLTSANPSRTFLLNESVDYLGVFYVHVKHTEPQAMKNRGFELNWTSTPSMLYLANRSEVNLDTSWAYYFANLNATQSDLPEFTVFLKENITELSLTFASRFNIHISVELSPQDPLFETGSTKTTLNSTFMTFLSVLPESTSNVTFQIEGGYKDENKTYLVSPGTWLIHNITVRAREENETLSFPHTEIDIKLENLSGTAKITVYHTRIAWDPNVDQNLDTAGIEEPLAIIVVLGTLSLLVVLTGNKRKYKK